MKNYLLIFFLLPVVTACKKNASPPLTIQPFNMLSLTINNKNAVYTGVDVKAGIRIIFSAPVKHSSVNDNIFLKDSNGNAVALTITFSNSDSGVVVQPAAALLYLKKYTVAVLTGLQSQQNAALAAGISQLFATALDSTDKFTRLLDEDLFDLVQKQTLQYFTALAHPVSGMALERSNGDANTCTTGGTGFGIMAIIAGVNRNFLNRTDGLARISKITSFLSNKCTRYHGAFAHWINGNTGVTLPFQANDDGADLVETSYLLQGLLCARQYFNTADATETALRNSINDLWNGVEWSWFRQGAQNQLFWHWSPTAGWAINLGIKGWNEALIAYVLAASSNTDAIPKIVYANGWAANGNFKNGNTYYGIPLPLGPALGGPLFFAHYSFLGINPNGLADAYASYAVQNIEQAQINYSYCSANPQNFYGYSMACWGLTASDDDQAGYSAHSPSNDNGTISPTAAIASLPYTPLQSINALKFFYYTLGDKIWGQYGFTDAFNLNSGWFASSFLAIDQGPQIVMIENYRSGLLWNLFTSCPEIKTGMKNLGFTAPYL